MKKLIAAIDLGTTKIVCIVGEKTPQGTKIIGVKQVPSKGIMRGEVINIQQVLNTMVPAVQEVEKAIGHNIKEVFVGIAGQNIRCETKSSQINRKDANELITKEEIDSMTNDMYGTFVQSGEKVLHVIPQSYNIDDFMGITEPIGMIGREISANFKLFIGRSNSAQYSNNVISRSGLKLKELILEPLASAKAILNEEEMEVGVAMVDIGGGTTDLLVMENNIIRHAAVIPFGGNSITEDIRIGCGISTKQAEELKINHGSCYSAYVPANKSVIIPGLSGRDSKEISLKFLSKIIEARVTEILEAVDYEIERSGYKRMLKAGIVLTGGTAKIMHLSARANLVTGLEARTALPEFSITEDSMHEVRTPELSTAVGLILKGFEKMENEGTVYETASPIDYKQDLFTDEKKDENLADHEAVTIEANTEKAAAEETEESRKKKGFFKKVFSSLSSDSMFKQDNQA